jgi:hypothetical protein
MLFGVCRRKPTIGFRGLRGEIDSGKEEMNYRGMMEGECVGLGRGWI